jgi:hypothetical protein
MHRIGIVLAAILLLPVIAAGVALLMGWPARTSSSISASAGFLCGWPAIWRREWLSGSWRDGRGTIRSRADAVAYPSEPMTMWPISTRVNNPRNDDAAILEPVEVGGQPEFAIAMTAARTVSLKTYRALAADARAALRMIREVVEQNAPPGSVPSEEYVEPPFTKKGGAGSKGYWSSSRPSDSRRTCKVRSRIDASYTDHPLDCTCSQSAGGWCLRSERGPASVQRVGASRVASLRQWLRAQLTQPSKSWFSVTDGAAGWA